MNDDHVFPPEWNWQRYEPVMREWMAQRARITAEKDRAHVAETLDKQRLSENWLEDQIDRGDFPPLEEREKYGDEYMKCLDRSFKEAQADLRAGRLRGGREHMSRRNVRYTQQQDGRFDLKDWDNVRPEDLEQRLKDKVRNKITDTVENLELKVMERHRRRRR